MSEFSVVRKTVLELLNGRDSDFLIPEYQRPYAWTEKECDALWVDLFYFSFPDNDCDKFDRKNAEYFLGPMVVFKNKEKKIEVIDGQQRLITLMLLLRAFYSRCKGMDDKESVRTRGYIESCLWKSDEFGESDFDSLKIDSLVITDLDKEEFISILKTGNVDKKQKSRYAINYRFFNEKIDDFSKETPSWFSYFPVRIMNNCILLPIESETQDGAFRIFSTLNDRGKPLTDSDIFKAQIYKYYKNTHKEKEFIEAWVDLESDCARAFSNSKGNPVDELFNKYMYFERAKQKQRTSSLVAVRKFYEKSNYSILQSDVVFRNLQHLAKFWCDVRNQNRFRFSDRVLKRLFVLNFAPNKFWELLVSVYFLKNRTDAGFLDDDKFYVFLHKITAFIWTRHLVTPGIDKVRTAVFNGIVDVFEGKPFSFDKFNVDEEILRNILEKFSFTNNREFTKSMLAWWLYHEEDGQPLLSLDVSYETEHIYAKNRNEIEHTLIDINNIDSIGNKSLLEKSVNIRASDYNFIAKANKYLGLVGKRDKTGTQVIELRVMAEEKDDFTEEDIVERKKRIIDAFVSFALESKNFEAVDTVLQDDSDVSCCVEQSTLFVPDEEEEVMTVNDLSDLSVDDIVVHQPKNNGKSWGKGKVMEVVTDTEYPKVRVYFDKFGLKDLDGKSIVSDKMLGVLIK